jgi:hypothetical protein
MDFDPNFCILKVLAGLLKGVPSAVARRLPARCGVWGRVSLSAKSYPYNMQRLWLEPGPYPYNMQRLGLEPGTFRLQTVDSTAAPGPSFSCWIIVLVNFVVNFSFFVLHQSFGSLDSAFSRVMNYFNFCRYGPLWITTTLIFMLAVFGNYATYLVQNKKDVDIWNFDVGYFSWAASVMYSYAIIVPVVFFFLFQYFGSRPSLVRFWCMWGYSLFIFIPASVSIRFPSVCFVIYITGKNTQTFNFNMMYIHRNFQFSRLQLYIMVLKIDSLNVKNP